MGADEGTNNAQAVTLRIRTRSRYASPAIHGNSPAFGTTARRDKTERYAAQSEILSFLL